MNARSYIDKTNNAQRERLRPAEVHTLVPEDMKIVCDNKRLIVSRASRAF